jgi:hypothetical protein
MGAAAAETGASATAEPTMAPTCVTTAAAIRRTSN